MNYIEFNREPINNDLANFAKVLKDMQHKIQQKMHKLEDPIPELESSILITTIEDSLKMKNIHENGIHRIIKSYLADDPRFAFSREAENYFNSLSYDQKEEYLCSGGMINPNLTNEEKYGLSIISHDRYPVPNGYIETINLPMSRYESYEYFAMNLAYISKNQKFIDKHYLYFIDKMLGHVTIYIMMLFGRSLIEKIDLTDSNHFCNGYYPIYMEGMGLWKEYHKKMISKVSTEIIDFVALTCFPVINVSTLISNSRVSEGVVKRLAKFIRFNSIVSENISDDLLLWFFDRFPHYLEKLEVKEGFLMGTILQNDNFEDIDSELFYKRKLSQKIIWRLIKYLDIKMLLKYGHITPADVHKYTMAKNSTCARK
jgi:hypothetical protein